MVRRAVATAAHPVHLLHAAALPLWHAELTRLAAAHPRFTFNPLAPGTLAAETQRRFIAADADRSRHFFICGVGALVPALRDMLRGAGYARRAVQYEKW
jgi:ferredoxin-NADP reductase